MAKGKEGSSRVLPSSQSQAVRVLFIIGLVLLLITGYIWWKQVASSPKNVFMGMLENSLKTSGVARHTLQESGVQNLEQTAIAQLAEPKIVHSGTTLTQQGAENTIVKTESVGTPTADYVRYTNIKTDQKTEAGQPLDFSNILGVWSRSPAVDPTQTSGELYGEATLGIVPFGYLPYEKRAEIMDMINSKNIYDADYATVKREKQNGRPVYIYQVEVNPEDYVTMLQAFARAVGLNQLESFQPESSRDSPKLQFLLTVDVWSRQLVGSEFVNSGRAETYAGYGAQIPVSVPENTIGVEELQTRLQSVQ